MEGLRTAAWEADQMEGAEEIYRKETATDDYFSGEDTLVTTTLGTEYNAPLAYAPGLELQHPIMSNIGEHGGE